MLTVNRQESNDNDISGTSYPGLRSLSFINGRGQLQKWAAIYTHPKPGGCFMWASTITKWVTWSTLHHNLLRSQLLQTQFFGNLIPPTPYFYLSKSKASSFQLSKDILTKCFSNKTSSDFCPIFY